MKPTAVVLNMFYTGLGIARGLAEHGVPVIGLSAQRGVYGNFTRYAKVLLSPDSRTEPEQLLRFLLQLGNDLGHRSIIFPTRDDDVVFLDRYQQELEPYFVLAVPGTSVVQACLDKWQTFVCAQAAGIPTPNCWLLESPADLQRVISEAVYPCVLKPVEAHHWRRNSNWEKVGSRKAIPIHSAEELATEYGAIAQVEQRALVQELIPGGDDSLLIAAVYMDKESHFVAGFNTQKLVQWPEGFGTGCIVQAVETPELFAPTIRLLESIGFTGIAEVEYKWDAASGHYKLIEINPRPWDQHRLGKSCGTDLVWLAYCEHAGLSMPVIHKRPAGEKWVAEDAFLLSLLRLLRRRDANYRKLLRLVQGRRIYAIWCAKDPLPWMVYSTTKFFPNLVKTGWQMLRRGGRKSEKSRTKAGIDPVLCDGRLDRRESHG